MSLGLVPFEPGYDRLKAVGRNGVTFALQGRRVRDRRSAGMNGILRKINDDPASAISVPTSRTGDAGMVSKDALSPGSRDERASHCPKVLTDGSKAQP